MIGLYGTIFFHSGSTGLMTFNEMKKTVTARWGDHPVHLQKPLLEYGGPQLIELSFRMELIKPWTADPLMTIVTLEEIMDLAIPLPLIIGMKPMGRGMSLFVLTSLSHEMKYFYRGGGLLGASVDVQLKEYPMSPAALLSSLSKALGGVFGQGAGGVGTDANAVTPTTYPTVASDPVSTMASTEQQAYNASVDKVVPQLAQNAGNPVPANLESGMMAQPPQPPALADAHALSLREF